MKSYFLCSALCLLAIDGLSQTDLYKNKPFKRYNFAPGMALTPTPSLQKTPEKIQGQVDRNVVTVQLRKHKVGAINPDTDLYIIEGYKMPCIAPSETIKNNMPITDELQKGQTPPAEVQDRS